ncbi:MAG: TlpA family protein disulfide reductase, partial [Pirellula sp.]|nr:TlpA family protein disulfide reductase [Pirellula sp.]
EADAKDFLSDFKKLGSRELMVAALSLMVFEVKGNLTQNLTFLQWLDDRLSAGVENPEATFLKNRIQRIRYRWQLIDKQLELVSANLSGEPFDLQSLRGKVVYVEFWSTGCPACIAELPALQRIYQNYQSKGFEIVAICVRSEPERIRRFVQSRNLPWVQICHDPTASIDCNGELFNQFGVEALPTTLLLDASGTVIAHGVRPLHQDSNRNLESILMKLIP